MADRNLRIQFILDGLDRLTAPLKKIADASSVTRKEIASTTAQIDKLNDIQKNIATFKKFDEALHSTNREISTARQKLTELRGQMAATDTPTKKLSSSYEKAEKTLAKLEAQQAATGERLQDYSAKLAEAGVNVSQLGHHEGRLTQQLGEANAALKQQEGALERINAAKRRSEKLKSAGSDMQMKGAITTAAITAPLAVFGGAAFQAAMDANEMESAFGETFGKSADHVKRWAEATGNRMERSTQEMMGMAMSYQDILGKQMDPQKAAELSKTLTVLTQDLASFKNLSNEDAKAKIFSGLIGEAEPLRSVGVLLSENAVQAKALAMGFKKVNGQLSEGDKVASRAALIMEQLGSASGDVLRTQDSTANRLKAAQTAWEELQIKIGQELLPKLTPLIDKFAQLVEMFTNLPAGVQGFIVVLAILAALIGPILIGVGLLTSAFGALSGAAVALEIGLAPMLGIVLLIVAAVAALIAIGYLIYSNWDAISTKLQEVFEPITDTLGPQFEALGASLSTMFEKIGDVAGKLGDLLMVLWDGPLGTRIRIFMDLVQQLAIIFGTAIGGTVIAVINTLVGVVTAAFDFIGNAISLVAALLTGNWSAAWEAVKGMFRAGADALLAILNGLGAIFSTIGTALMDGLVAGIRAGWETVKATFRELASLLPSWVTKPLEIHSPSRVFARIGGHVMDGLDMGLSDGASGPLSRMGQISGDLTKAFAVGAAVPAMALASPTAGAVGNGAMAQGASGGVTYNISVNANGSNAQDIARQVRDAIEQMERERKGRTLGDDSDY